MVLLARTKPYAELKKPSEGLSLFFVDIKEEDGVTSKKGVELRKIRKMGGRGVDANQVGC
jgi:acyl-CoA dehydrogenase